MSSIFHFKCLLTTSIIQKSQHAKFTVVYANPYSSTNRWYTCFYTHVFSEALFLSLSKSCSSIPPPTTFHYQYAPHYTFPSLPSNTLRSSYPSQTISFTFLSFNRSIPTYHEEELSPSCSLLLYHRSVSINAKKKKFIVVCSLRSNFIDGGDTRDNSLN